MDHFEHLSLAERKLIVAVDFGTTYSGVAWAETRRPDTAFVIEQWPARLGTREGESSIKVPTELLYTSEGTEWGFQIPKLEDRHHWFKLGLGDNKQSEPGSKSAEELTTDYLTELYKHVLYILEQKIGVSASRTLPIELCLTVPAIWSEVAKEKTLKACQKACQKASLKSQSEVMLVSEPEAAAMYALHGLDPHGLSIGDSFVLCDAGGGTVDLISYQITALQPILKVKELTVGTGGLCGSTYLNRRFSDFLTRKLGGEAKWHDEVLAEAMDRFDYVIKKQYSPSTDNSNGYSIPVPGLDDNPRLGVRRGKITVSKTDMRDIFEPIILEIITLVREQIRSSASMPRTVLLVGGFGQNNYLKERLRESLNGVKVLQPPNAWIAVARGAVMMGLSRANESLTTVGVVSRKARKHYGVEFSLLFDKAIHDESRKRWDPFYGRYEVSAMDWFIRKGDVVEENKPKVISFCLRRDYKPKSDEMRILADSHSEVAPIYKCDSVKELVKLQAHFSHFSKSDWAKATKKGKDGRDWYYIDASIEVTFFSASTKYVLSYDEKKYDTVTAEYV